MIGGGWSRGKQANQCEMWLLDEREQLRMGYWVKPWGSKQIESWYSYSCWSSGNVMMPPSLARCLFTVYNFVNEFGWIAILLVPPCFDCIFDVFQDFELKFLVNQKLQHRAKISVLHFSPPFSSNRVEISCVMSRGPTLVDQVSDHPLNWFFNHAGQKCLKWMYWNSKKHRKKVS